MGGAEEIGDKCSEVVTGSEGGSEEGRQGGTEGAGFEDEPCLQLLLFSASRFPLVLLSLEARR